MKTLQSPEPIQSIPSSGICMGPFTGRTRAKTSSIMNASSAIMIHCMYSHCE